MKALFLITTIILSAFSVFAQPPDDVAITEEDTIKKVRVVPYVVENGDTIPTMSFEEFELVVKDEQSRKLERRVRAVYPYAVVVASLLDKFEEDTKTMSKRQKKKYYKQAHEILKLEFTNELKYLSVEEGKVLMKLINREAGINAYDLVKQLRGGTTAMLGQAAAKLYGSSMKQTYDAEGEDAEIEMLILQIEAGELIPIERPPKTHFAKEAVKERKRKAKERRKKRKKQQRLDRKNKRKEKRKGEHV